MYAKFERVSGRIQVDLPRGARQLVIDYANRIAELLVSRPGLDPATLTKDQNDQDAGEHTVWAHLVASLASDQPAHPVVARLLPSASHDDAELAASFRRLTEHDLMQRKHEYLLCAVQALSRRDPVLLTDVEVPAVLKTLNDIRLLLGQELTLQSDADSEYLHDELIQVTAGFDLAGIPLQMFLDEEPTSSEVKHTMSQLARGHSPAWVRNALAYDAFTWWQESLLEALAG